MTAASANFYVYILFRLNGLPCYVGKGKGDRWQRHQGRANHKNRHLGSIIDQARVAGKELPRVKVCENMTEEAAFELERLLIGCIGRGDNGPLVNLTDGGDGASGYRHSPEQIASNPRTRGKERTPEWRAKVSVALKGKRKTPEHAAAAGAGQIGSKKKSGWWSTPEGRAKQRANNRGNTGNRHSAESIAKIKAARAEQSHVLGTFQPGHVPWNKGSMMKETS